MWAISSKARRSPLESAQGSQYPGTDPAGTDDLLHEESDVVVENHHMVGVPPHWMAHVKKQFRDEKEGRRDLAGDKLGG